MNASESLSDYKEKAPCAGADRPGCTTGLDQPYRLIFVRDGPMPEPEEGGLYWSKVTAIEIPGVEDTHGSSESQSIFP